MFPSSPQLNVYMSAVPGAVHLSMMTQCGSNSSLYSPTPVFKANELTFRVITTTIYIHVFVALLSGGQLSKEIIYSYRSKLFLFREDPSFEGIFVPVNQT